MKVFTKNYLLRFCFFSCALLVLMPQQLHAQKNKNWQKAAAGAVVAAGIAGSIIKKNKQEKATQKPKKTSTNTKESENPTTGKTEISNDEFLPSQVLEIIKAEWKSEEKSLEKGFKISITEAKYDDGIVLIKGYTENGKTTSMFGASEFYKLISKNITGDLNNDGKPEIIVLVNEFSGGNSSLVMPYLFSQTTGSWALLSTGVIARNDSDLCSSNFDFQRIENGFLVAEMACLAPNDPRCCPSQYYKVYFKLSNQELVLYKKEKISKKN